MNNTQTTPTLFWDWNGTLLDDCTFSMNVMNRLLAYRKLPLLRDEEHYRSLFCFPVENYYRKLGLKEEDWEEDAHRWMNDYMSHESQCPARDGAVQAVTRLRQLGCRQLILTASKTENLLAQLTRFPEGLFDGLLGLSHIYATSKTEIGKEYIRQNGLDPKMCVMIGDSLHDA